MILEVRPGVYYKNVQIAHIYGVRRGTPRFAADLSDEERDAFRNLLLLCLAHHSAIDDKKTGEKLYPPELLHKWKHEHEGKNGPALAALGTISKEDLDALLVDVFAPPVERLQAIAEQLEKTGTLTKETVAELRQIIGVLTDAPVGPDATTTSHLVFAAEMLGGQGFNEAAKSLASAAETLPSSDEINQLIAAAEVISAAASEIRRYGGEQ
ncbi:MAG: hypothetical protein WBF75_04770 [Pseudonocardiaceae bacterium]